jgi:hypothetical protein
MKKMRIGSLALIAGCVLLCLAIPAFGNDVTINFTGVANTSVQTLGAYAGYYTGTVNGVAATPGFICDDYNNEIFLPSESWQATATSFASLATTPGALASTDFGSTLNLDGYAAIAYLSNLMATTPAAGQADISAAIWYVGALGTGSYSGPLGTDSIPWSSLDSTAQGYVESLLGATGEFGAIGSATSTAITELESSDLWIYTPTGNDIEPSSDPTPQEFIGDVAVPEPGLLSQLALSLGLLGGLLLARKRLRLEGWRH